jgi:hypothetical protein
MNVRCFGCGQLSNEVTGGPDPEEVGQHNRWDAGVLDLHDSGKDCFAVVVCWKCFWSLDPDMWISGKCYNSLNPIVPLDKLPKLDHDNEDCWNPEFYKWPLEDEIMSKNHSVYKELGICEICEIEKRPNHEHCPKCNSTSDRHEVRNYNAMWHDGDIHCMDCNAFVRRYDAG